MNRIIDDRAAKGLKIFAVFAIIITGIGILMHLRGKYATGYSARLSRGYNASLSGKQVVLPGSFMLLLDLLF